jgi:hypothetical protein
MITEDHIRYLVDQVIKYNLDAPSYLFDIGYLRMSLIYNGCGPDWLPSDIRKRLTAPLSFFEPMFLIHDVRFEFGDKTREGFNAANLEMFYNGRKLINGQFPWWSSPFKHWAHRTANVAIYLACDSHVGWLSWNAAPKTEV